MAHFIYIEQDEAFFEIQNPQNAAELLAAQIIAEYNEQEEMVRVLAMRKHNVRFSSAARGLVGDVDGYKRSIDENMKGFSYERQDGIERWQTPSGCVSARFVAAQNGINKFELFF